ncbi:wax ester synthase/diacylglycerol acyltransferase 2-like [Argentina anserina]|uniref:wax ester synthase/diacylglycerol acyltransferase 2-like n=1 Tax=Argentina anserina TaxID=57926 RepID=UPI0021767103|nr:wax ester synthase/diacylglycerol acyltransferase 2-like [Potentilla anserina]
MELQFEEEGLQPVSPTGQYFSSPVLSVSNLGVMETEVPIDESPTMSMLKNVFLPISPRFSSIMVERRGKKQWKRVEVNLEDHVNIPVFPSGLSPASYDKYFDDYISKLAVERLPQHKPLWEIHIIKYPTTTAAGTIIFKLHQALGDGFSMMGALLSCLQRADNPSLPLTFPSRRRSQSRNNKNGNFVTKVLSSVSNTISDFFNSNMEEDDQTPIRSGNDGIEFKPIAVSTMTIPLDRLKLIKNRLGVTINDVLAAMIFLGTRLYMPDINKSSSEARGTAVVLLNTRMMGNYTSVQEMTKPNSKLPWGNHISLLQVPIPKLLTNGEEQIDNALDFVWKAHNIIRSKRHSWGIHLTAGFLEILNKFGGHESAARYIRNSLKKSSMIISNLIGPVEQMSVANHPVQGFYFLVFGSPEGLDVTIVSYMEKVRIAFKMEKGLIDPPKFKSFMEKSFDMILKASEKNVVEKN